MCGKNLNQRHTIIRRVGSPPHVREKRTICFHLLNIRRITPACAGKTLGHCFGLSLYQDHPRVCGKNDGEASELETIKGSPPRVREKLWYSIATGRYSRITPACAGKARKLSLPVVLVWDHPRVCGKNVCSTCEFS